MTVGQSDQRPILCEGFLEMLKSAKPMVSHTFRAGKLALAGLVEKAQAFAAVRVSAREHPKRYQKVNAC